MSVTILLNIKLSGRVKKNYNKPLNYFLKVMDSQIHNPTNTLNWKLPKIKKKLVVRFL